MHPHTWWQSRAELARQLELIAGPAAIGDERIPNIAHLKGMEWTWRLGSVGVSLPLDICAAGLVDVLTLEGFAAKVSEP